MNSPGPNIDAMYHLALKSLSLFEQSERNFQGDKKELIERGLEQGLARKDAELRASKHPDVQSAATDCAYFRERTIMYSNMVTMMLAMEKRGVPSTLRKL